MVGNPRIFKGMVSTVANLVQDTIFSCLDYCNLPLTSPALALSPTVLSPLCILCYHSQLTLHCWAPITSGFILCCLPTCSLHSTKLPSLLFLRHTRSVTASRDLPGPHLLLNIHRANSSTSFRSLLKCPLISDIVLDHFFLPWYFLFPLL